MPSFQYRAMDQHGQLVTGQIEADTEAGAASLLRAKSLYVMETTPDRNPPSLSSTDAAGKPTAKPFWEKLSRRISVQQRIFFFRQLSVMLKSGLPLVQALDVCRLGDSDAQMSAVIQDLVRVIQRGTSLSGALKEFPDIFPLTAVKLIESGEASGDLDEVLERVASHMEVTAAMKGKLITSMAYPAIVVLAAVGVGTFLTLTVIPKFTEYFSKRNLDLPASTELLMSISATMQDYGLFIILGLFSLGIGITILLRYPEWRLRFSRFSIKAPIVGKVIEVSAMAQLGKTLSMLIGSGLTVTEAMQIASSTVDNVAYQNGLLRSVKNVLRGEPLSESFEKDAFPALVIQMISVGEQTGELSRVLEHMGKFYESQLEARISRMSALIEPMILVFIGGMVGFVYFAFFKAVFQIALAGH